MVHVDKIAIPTPGGNHHSEEFTALIRRLSSFNDAIMVYAAFC